MIRPLAHGEAALAREVFGRDLRLDDIRFLGSPWPFDRAFVPGRWFGRDWIVWPSATLAPDLSQGRGRGVQQKGTVSAGRELYAELHPTK